MRSANIAKKGNAYKIWLESLKARNRSDDLGIDGKYFMLKKQGV
jgi:hypothetical protein